MLKALSGDGLGKGFLIKIDHFLKESLLGALFGGGLAEDAIQKSMIFLRKHLLC